MARPLPGTSSWLRVGGSCRAGQPSLGTEGLAGHSESVSPARKISLSGQSHQYRNSIFFVVVNLLRYLFMDLATS